MTQGFKWKTCTAKSEQVKATAPIKSMLRNQRFKKIRVLVSINLPIQPLLQTPEVLFLREVSLHIPAILYGSGSISALSL